MTETEYLRAVESVLGQVETAFERLALATDCALAGHVLTIEFDDGARIVLNAQAPTRQLWLAARTGAMHFAHDGTAWKDLRSGEEFFAALSRVASDLAGEAVVLSGA
jgi:CyaY protein